MKWIASQRIHLNLSFSASTHSLAPHGYKDTALETHSSVPQPNLRSVFSIDYILPQSAHCFSLSN